MSDLAEKNPGLSQAYPLGERPRTQTPRRRLSVVLKLTLLVGLTLATLISILLTCGWFKWVQVRGNQMQALLSSTANSRRATIQAQIALLQQRAELNTDRGEFRGFLYELAIDRPTENRASCQTSLDRMVNQKPIVGASLVNEAGVIVLSSDPARVGQNVSALREFQAGKSNPHLGNPYPATGRFEALLGAPVRTRSDPNRVYGVLLLRADVADLATVLQDHTGLGRTGEAILGVPEDQQIRFLFPPRNAPETTTVPVGSAPALHTSTKGVESFFKNRDYRGVPVLAAGRPIGYGGWALVVKMDEKEAFAPVTDALYRAVLGGVIATVLSLIAAYFMALRFTRPVRQLTQAAARVAGGDYHTVVPVESNDEFGALAKNFNEMTATLCARRDERDQAETALREADRHKDEFLAVLGHELRNPLSAIAHSVRVIEASADDPHADEAAREVISRQTVHLTRLVEDLLDVARISKGKIELRKQRIEIGEALLRAVETIRPLTDRRRHSVDLVLTNGGQIWIDADPTRFDQIITNLLINAAKYTPDGGRITIAERLEGRDAVITIRDTGIGISPEMQAQIFELFSQGDHSLEHHVGGLGIGLSLCRQLVELHGGNIVVHSAGLGKGATFTLRFPAVEAPGPSASSKAGKHRPTGRARRILLVDDNVDTLHSMNRLLTLRGHQVATATDGLAALQVARDFQPDFILLDIGLPGMDGYSLARRLRAEGFTDTPIIAISGYAQENDRHRSREAGFNHHFAKPVDFEALAELILEEPLSAD